MVKKCFLLQKKIYIPRFSLDSLNVTVKIFDLLNEAGDSKFSTRNWSNVSNQSNANYCIGNKLIYNSGVLKYNLYDYNDGYILIKGNITILGHNVTLAAFKICAPFIKCITKVDGTVIDNSEDLHLVMQIHNLLECSSNYFDTTGSLWFYSKDKASSFKNDIANINNFNYKFYYIKLCTNPNFKFHEKAKLLRKTEANAVKDISRKATIAVSLKYVSNFWMSLEMPLINCKVELKLK